MASYTDQQPTRIYRRDAGAVDTQRNAIGNTQPMARKEGLFEGISLSQIIAGAAAAATSMVLASHLGWAGSVIGAAVSSVVTVISSQVYRKFLQAGAEKLKGGRAASEGASSYAAYTRYPSSDEQRAIADDHPATTQAVPLRSTRVAPARLQARAAAERAAERASTQRKVVVFSIVIAIVAVAICATAILLGTAGEGLGTKAQPLFSTPATTTPSADDSTEEAPDSSPATEITTDKGTDAADGTVTDTSSPDDAASTGDTGTGGSTDAGSSSDSATANDDTAGTGGTGSASGSTDPGTGTGTAGSDGTGSTSGGTATTNGTESTTR